MRSIFPALALLLFVAVTSYSKPCIDTSKVVMPVMSKQAADDLESKLDEARLKVTISPNNIDADSMIWYGRRTAYTGRYKEAIGIYSSAIQRFFEDARFYRHRGHRYITIRCFDDAIRDLETAAKLIEGKPDEIEPDGMPNARNIPTSTLQSNIWYHLGLAYYLKGDFKKAMRAYEEAQKVSKNSDMRVATTYWHYMTLRRLGRRQEAKKLLESFAGEIEVIENTDYLKLIKLNRGEITPEALLAEIGGNADTLGSASLGYGIGNYYLYKGDKKKAAEIFRKVTNGNQWASFGFIAAEQELARK